MFLSGAVRCWRIEIEVGLVAAVLIARIWSNLGRVASRREKWNSLFASGLSIGLSYVEALSLSFRVIG